MCAVPPSLGSPPGPAFSRRVREREVLFPRPCRRGGALAQLPALQGPGAFLPSRGGVGRVAEGATTGERGEGRGPEKDEGRGLAGES
jgi:hypothetical protein